jgi:hypothetical protein
MEQATVVNLHNEETMEVNAMETEAVVTPVTPVAKNKLGFGAGLAIGAGAGLTIGITAAFMEKKTRKDLYNQLENVVKIIKGLHSDKREEKIEVGKGFKKKEVDLAKKTVENTEQLKAELMENITNVKMRKKEKKEWIELFGELVEVSFLVGKKSNASLYDGTVEI